MLIVMKPVATAEQVAAVVRRIESLGFRAHPIPGAARTAIGVTGNQGPLDPALFSLLEGVADAIPVSKPYKLVSRDVKPDDTIIDLGDGVRIGAGQPIAIAAGPCSVESREQLLETARAVKAGGANLLRGGAFKPRTSPYAFQGLRAEGLELLAEAARETGLKVVTEVKDTETLPLVARYTDVLQVGARNMQNFSLLEAIGEMDKPVLLKRGLSATILELLLSAEYIAARGNMKIILCERGIRTFETATRNTLDLSAVPLLKSLTHLPVMSDPSHGVGLSKFVPAMANASVACGADGLIIEVHPRPAEALSDGQQSLTPAEFARAVESMRRVATAVGRELR